MIQAASEVADDSDANRSDIMFFKEIWRNLIPSKVATLAWRIGLQRMSTLDNLLKRRVIIQNNNNGGICGLCKEQVESTNHLCFSYSIWVEYYKYMGISSTKLPHDGKSHFLQHG